MNSARATGIAAVLAILAMIALIIDASLERNVFTIFVLLYEEKWGRVTVVDLYVGFFITGAWIVISERRALRYMPWLLAMAVLGNVASLAYVAWRAINARSLTQIIVPPWALRQEDAPRA